MNYGFQPDGQAPPIALDQLDEPDRFCIQLYHEVASAIDLSGLDVLEVGSGRGGGASYIKRYLAPRTMTGVDFSQKAVELCRQRHTVSDLQFQHGDAEAIPFDANRFGAVVNVESSHCYGSAATFFGEAARVLKAGGHFLFADFRPQADLETLDQQLQSAGLETIERVDITDNVLAAMEADSERKQSLIRTHIAGWLSGTFQQFAGLEGTQVYDSFASRELVYMRYCLRKP